MIEDTLKSFWPEWQIIKQIGRGSYGVVYEAIRTDHNIESHAAIKVITIPQNESEIDSLRSEGYTAEATKTYLQQVVNDFVREIQIMESFKGVQNIVSVEDYKVVEHQDGIGWDIFIRMELLTPLITYISNKTLSEAEVVKLGIDICTALERCAAKNVIHRDIKPENIFVNQFGDFKLGDFGIARKLEHVTYGMSQRGTYNYMAPEVERGPHYDATVDIYSLGLVLYRFLNNNRLPFLNSDSQYLNPNDRAAALRRRMDGEPLPKPCNASPAMAEVILRACSYNPADRFSTATEMKHALEYASQGGYAPDYMGPTELLTPLTGETSATVAVNKAPARTEENNVPHKANNPRLLWVIPVLCLGIAAGFGAGLWRNNKSSAQSEEPQIVTASPKGEDSTNDSAENKEAAVGKTDEESAVSELWYLAPSLAFDSISQLPAFGSDLSGISEEKKGMPQNWRSDPVFGVGKDFYSGNALMIEKNGKYGFYDFSGNNLMPVCFEDLNGYIGRYLVTYNGEYYSVSEDFTVLYHYDSGGAGSDNGGFYAMKDGVFGFANGAGGFEPLDISEFDFSDRLAIAVVNDANEYSGWEIISNTGSELSKVYTGDDYSFTNGMVCARKGKFDDPNKWFAYVNADTDTQITDFIYEADSFFQNGIASVKKDGKWGFIDDTGKELSEFIFDDASVVYDGKAYVKYNGLYGIIDVKKAASNNTFITNDICSSGISSVQEQPIPEGAPIIGEGEMVIGTAVVKVGSLNIRQGSYEESDAVGQCNAGDIFAVYAKNANSSLGYSEYDWYCIGDNMWIADKNGEWIDYHEE